jgi:hypothetical protein
MNPYAILVSNIATPEASALCQRLTAWHDTMVAHERRLRTTSRSEVCEDDCPHAEARVLWREAVSVFGPSAHQLSFLRSRGLSGVDVIPAFDVAARGALEL